MLRALPTHLVQLTHPDERRRAALVDGGELHLLATYRSIYDFAMTALETRCKLRDLLSTDRSGIVLDYDEVYALKTSWRFLSAFDHPQEPGRCLVSALEGETWQYQGSGDCLCGHGEPMAIPAVPVALHLPELAAAYVIGEEGVPRRLGVAVGIRGPRHCCLGPELIADAEFPCIQGSAALIRAGREIWSRGFSRGQAPLPLALAAVESRHFERASHRRRGDAHVHFFGAKLFGNEPHPLVEDSDEAAVELHGFGRGLRTRLLVEKPLIPVATLPL
jgi:hypothetical protein